MDDMPRPFLLCGAQSRAGIPTGCRLMASQGSGVVFMLACPGLPHTGNNVLKGSDHCGSQDSKDCKPNDPICYIQNASSFSSSAEQWPLAAFIPDYSGGTAPDFHGIPCSTRFGSPDQIQTTLASGKMQDNWQWLPPWKPPRSRRAYVDSSRK